MKQKQKNKGEGDLNLKSLKQILEIAYCIEAQFEPETRLLLMVSGMWSMNGEKAAYFKWIDNLWDKAIIFCVKEKLIC